MSRRLWLVYERIGHPDAVSYPATEEDARLVAELIAHPYAKRLHIAEQLRNFLKRQERLGLPDRQRVPYRRASGLYHLVPWRLAKWLSLVLAADDAVAGKTRQRIEAWIDSKGEPQILNPTIDG
jgi:hypothetical protein